MDIGLQAMPRYDAGGRLKEKWLPNGVNSRYAYNTDNTLTQMVNRSLTTTIISQHDCLYDVYANRRQQISNITGSALTHAYTFDALDRLLTVKQTAPLDATKDETYTYDPLNNLKTQAIGTPVTATTAFVHDAANQLLEGRSGTVAGALLAGYVYDANGSLTKKCVGGTLTRTAIDCTATGGAVTSLTYDSLDRMTQAVAATTESYAYDQEGKRIRKVSGATTTNFHYMGPDIYAEYGTTFTAQTAITTHGPGNDDPILRQTGTGPTAIAKFYHQDGLGSVVAVSTATGTTDGTQRFDAWGNKTTVTGAAVATFGYTGREPDASGLTYYRARYYDPSMQRFTQRDPIGFGGGLNQYAYVGNNPTNLTDPSGNGPENILLKGLQWLGGKLPRNARLAGEVHPKTGIPFKETGFPDFSSVATKEVKITQSGSSAADFAAANKAAGLEQTPKGFTWHHVEDGNTMQLVPTNVHAATGHTGGAAMVKGAGAVAGVAAVGSAEAAQQGIFGTGITWPDVGNFVVDFLVPGGVGGAGEGSDIVRGNANQQYFGNTLPSGGSSKQTIRGVSPGG